MASNIDPSQPPASNPTTAAMRANMAAAKAEIEALQGLQRMYIRAVIPEAIPLLGDNSINFSTLYDINDNTPPEIQLPDYSVVLICNVHWRVYSDSTAGEVEGGLTSYASNSFASADMYHQMLFDVYQESTTMPIGSILHEKHSIFYVPAIYSAGVHTGYVNRTNVIGSGAPIADWSILGWMKV